MVQKGKANQQQQLSDYIAIQDSYRTRNGMKRMEPIGACASFICSISSVLIH